MIDNQLEVDERSGWSHASQVLRDMGLSDLGHTASLKLGTVPSVPDFCPISALRFAIFEAWTASVVIARRQSGDDNLGQSGDGTIWGRTGHSPFFWQIMGK
jgi:hypothetical protein